MLLHTVKTVEIPWHFQVFQTGTWNLRLDHQSSDLWWENNFGQIQFSLHDHPTNVWPLWENPHHQCKKIQGLKHLSTETAILKIVSDILQAADSGKVTLLGLLDMSSAIDTVDHDILLDHLHKLFGISGTVLSWVESLLLELSEHKLSYWTEWQLLMVN